MGGRTKSLWLVFGFFYKHQRERAVINLAGVTDNYIGGLFFGGGAKKGKSPLELPTKKSVHNDNNLLFFTYRLARHASAGFFFLNHDHAAKKGKTESRSEKGAPWLVVCGALRSTSAKRDAPRDARARRAAGRHVAPLARAN